MARDALRPLVLFVDSDRDRSAMLKAFFERRGFDTDDVPRITGFPAPPPSQLAGILVHQADLDSEFCSRQTVPIVHYSGGATSFLGGCRRNDEVLLQQSISRDMTGLSDSLLAVFDAIAEWLRIGGRPPTLLAPDPHGFGRVSSTAWAWLFWLRAASSDDAGVRWSRARASLRGAFDDRHHLDGWLQDLREDSWAISRTAGIIERAVRGRLAPALAAAVAPIGTPDRAEDAYRKAVESFAALCRRTMEEESPVSGDPAMRATVEAGYHAWQLLAAVHL